MVRLEVNASGDSAEWDCEKMEFSVTVIAPGNEERLVCLKDS